MVSVFWCVLFGVLVFVAISAFFWVGLYVSGITEDLRREVRRLMQHD